MVNDNSKTDNELRIVITPDGIQKTLIDGMDVAIILGVAAINHWYIGGGWVLDLLALFFGMSFMLSRANAMKHKAFRGTREEAIRHLEELGK